MAKGLNIEREIEKILGIEEPHDAENQQKRKVGRPATRILFPIWAVSEEATSRSRTLALISMCIKEDFEQSLPSLAHRVALYKGRPYAECLAVLRELRKKGKLGYYNDECRLIKWNPGRRNEKGR